MKTINVGVIGTATIDNEQEPDVTREQLITALNGAELHVEIDGISMRITLEFDPHSADE